jgi:hypothetical protein
MKLSGLLSIAVDYDSVIMSVWETFFLGGCLDFTPLEFILDC